MRHQNGLCHFRMKVGLVFFLMLPHVKTPLGINHNREDCASLDFIFVGF